MVTSPQEQVVGTYPFVLLLVSPSPTYQQNMSPIGVRHLDICPHQTCMNRVLEIKNYLIRLKTLFVVSMRQTFLWLTNTLEEIDVNFKKLKNFIDI
jgi:hypothetical protein